MKPYAELLYYSQINPNTRWATRIRDSFKLKEPEDIIEFAGRWDYGENNARKLGETSKMGDEQVPIIQKYLAMGHESMIEMGFAVFFITCSRVVSHELCRHRLASFQQESQRFVKYDMTFQEWYEAMYYPEGMSDIMVTPSDYTGDTANEVMYRAYQDASVAYQVLRRAGVAPQDARYVLPNGMRTNLIMGANVREWRHILKLRLDKSAQPEMQELMKQIYDQLVEVYPNSLHGVLDSGRQVR